MPTRTTWKRKYPLTGLTSAMLMGGAYKGKRRRVAKGSYRTTGYYGRYSPLGSELKFLDTTDTKSSVNASGTIKESSLVNVVAGTGESQRVGRKITIKSIHMRYIAQLSNTSNPSGTDDGLRVIVYWDKQCNGATAAVTDILETAEYLSFNNLSNKNRFSILMDKTVDISATAGAYDGTNDQFGQKAVTRSFHKKVNIPVEYSSTTGGLTEIRSNNIGLLAISDAGAINMGYTCRVRFSDN